MRAEYANGHVKVWFPVQSSAHVASYLNISVRPVHPRCPSNTWHLECGETDEVSFE